MAVYTFPKESHRVQRAAETSYTLGTGDYVATQMGHAFERTTLGLFGEENRISEAEEAAGTYWSVQDLLPNADAVTFDISAFKANEEGKDSVHPAGLPKEAFEAGGYSRGGKIAWTPTTTLQRAEIEAEVFDKRRHEEQLLSRGTPTQKFLGFGAALLANLPDPINFVPVLGAGAKGASLGTRMARGLTEGVASTAMADAVLLPMAARKGDSVEWSDLTLDMTFGALIGGGIGGVSGLMHRKRVAGLAGEQSELAKALRESGYDEGAATKLANDVTAQVADMPRRNEMARRVRKATAGLNRRATGKLMDKVLFALNRGEDLDVGRWAKELGLNLPETIAFHEVENLLRQLDSGDFQKASFGKLSADKLEAVNAIRQEEGMRLVEGENLVLPANIVKKLYESRMVHGGQSADEVAQMLLDVFHLEADAASATHYPHIQAILKLRKTLSTLGFISVDPHNGETLIKSVYLKNNENIGNALASNQPGRTGLSSISLGADAPLAAPRLSDLQTGSEKTLDVTASSVKDFSMPLALPTVEPAPLGQGPELEIELGGASLDEVEAARILESTTEPDLYTADAQTIRELDFEMQRIDQVERATLAVLGCVMGVL